MIIVCIIKYSYFMDNSLPFLFNQDMLIWGLFCRHNGCGLDHNLLLSYVFSKAAICACLIVPTYLACSYWPNPLPPAFCSAAKLHMLGILPKGSETAGGL